MKEYNENNLLLLPPRLPEEGLPKELLEYYKEYSSKHRDNGRFTRRIFLLVLRVQISKKHTYFSVYHKLPLPVIHQS